MTTIKGIVKGGRLNLATPPDWPEGCEVIVEPTTMPTEKIGLDESEWSDDPASIADWEAWLKTIEPLEFTADEEAAFNRFGEEMRRCSIEAVRRQMESEPLP